MCGILGFVNFKEGVSVTTDFKTALEKIKYRGPDNQGIFRSGKVVLGHNRLSIIDTSAAANQPFAADDRYFLVFNGEIFNFKELKDELSASTQFATTSDTEVLMQLLIQKGDDTLKLLNGFFAFAFYDKEKETLLLARDRFGIKPLYVQQNGDNFCFSSELNALTTLSYEKKTDFNALQNYLRFNFLPPDSAMIEDAGQLTPGHFLRLSKSGIEKGQYYDLLQPQKAVKSSKTELQDELKKLLKNAVQKQMMSDVPIGCFLSGGIDSSIVCALAAQETKHLNTFTIGFKNDKFYDESGYAEIVSKKYKTEHHCFYVSEDDMLNEVDFLLNNFSEPFADSSAIAVSLLCRHTAQKVTVALSGDGADELFAGYNRYRAAIMMEQKGLKYNFIRGLYPFFKNLKVDESSPIGNKIRQIQKFDSIGKLGFTARYLALCENRTANEAVEFLNSTFSIEKSTESNEIITQKIDEQLGISTYILNDMRFILPCDMLTKVDRASMLHSLEVRPVFLDNDLAEFGMKLPLKYKLNRKSGKVILKETFADMLPPEILNHPKHGFEVPLEKWFSGALKNTLEEYLSKDFIMNQSIFNFDAVDNLKKQFYTSKSKSKAASLWAILVFNKWWERELKTTSN